MLRAGKLYHQINFYAKVSTRDASGYSASADSWPSVTLKTRGEIREVSGSRTVETGEKFYSKSKELTVRYNSAIVENMKVQIDNTNDLWNITYIEIVGRNAGLKLSLERATDGSTFLTDDSGLVVVSDDNNFLTDNSDNLIQQ